MRVAIIGGGAAGFFSAFSVKSHHPNAEVVIFEKSSKLLAKVKVSGGGRCNVTHHCMNSNQLSKHYPRGEKFLKKAFAQFSVADTLQWFEERKVALKIEEDGRMFPITDSSQTIIDCFLSEAKKLDIAIELKCAVSKISHQHGQYELTINEVKKNFTHVIVCSGGSAKISGFNWLADIGHEIVSPVPSLFTFNMPNNPVTKLMGLSVPNAQVKIQRTKLRQYGPLLITHWGMSGPAILKTSAWGARELNDLKYHFIAQICWVGESNESELRDEVNIIKQSSPKKQLANHRLQSIPNRLWQYLLQKNELREDITWGELGKKGVNKLINLLLNDTYEVNGKTTFKEEFVTCGGVSLQHINVATMESKVAPKLYFAGEVMDIDGVTGGFNFQAAWTTGFIAGKLG